MLLWSLQDQRAGQVRSVEAAFERLHPVLVAAASTDLCDSQAWQRLSIQAQAALGVLIEGGLLPAHLAIDSEDPPVVVTRALAAAWRRGRDLAR